MQSKDVAVFWDLESCDMSCSAKGYDVARSICSVALTFGIIRQIRAYVHLNTPLAFCELPEIRSELQISGISITDCPETNEYDKAVERVMLVDMLAYAIDNPEPSRSTIILISGDRNFAYAMSTLRLRGFKMVLISPDTVHASLKAQASEWLDWHLDVLYADHEALQDDASVESQSTFQAECRRSRPLQSQTSLNGWISDCDPHMNGGIDHVCNLSQRDSRLPSSRSSNVSSRKNFGPKKAAPPVAQTLREGPEVVEDFVVPAIENPTPVRPFSVAISSDNVSVSQPSVRGVPTTNSISLNSLSPGNASTSVSLFVQGSSGATSSSASNVSPSVTPAVPVIYRPLVEILRSFRSKGVLQPLRSQFAGELVKKHANVYKSAGVKKFSQYVFMAEAAGIVELGGKDGGAWIRLRPEFRGA